MEETATDQSREFSGKAWKKWYFRRRGYIPIPVYLPVLFLTWNICRDLRLTLPIGGGLAILGIVLRVWSARYLEGGAHVKSLRRPRSLTRNGPYNCCRNPIYLATVLMAAGLVALAGLFYYLPILVVYLLIHYTIVIRCEEEVLLEKFGEEYRLYLQEVPRWIPRIRRDRSGQELTDWKIVWRREWKTVFGILVLAAVLMGKNFYLVS